MTEQRGEKNKKRKIDRNIENPIYCTACGYKVEMSIYGEFKNPCEKCGAIVHGYVNATYHCIFSLL